MSETGVNVVILVAVNVDKAMLSISFYA